MKRFKFFVFNMKNNFSIQNELNFLYSQYFSKQFYPFYMDGDMSDLVAKVVAYFHYMLIISTINHYATYHFVDYTPLNKKLNK